MDKLRVTIPFPTYNFTLELFQDELYPKARRFWIPDTLIDDNNAEDIVNTLKDNVEVVQPRFSKINKPQAESLYQFSFHLDKTSVKVEKQIMDSVNEILGRILTSNSLKQVIADKNIFLEELEKIEVGDMILAKKKSSSNFEMNLLVGEVKRNSLGDIYSISGINNGGYAEWDITEFVSLLNKGYEINVVKKANTAQVSNTVIEDLKKVEKGDVVKVINKKDGSIRNEIVVNSTNIGTTYWAINGIDRGQTASLYDEYWQEIFKDGNFDVQIIKKQQIKAESKNILAVSILLHDITKVLGFEKTPNALGLQTWKLSTPITGQIMPSYRQEFFVEGDVIELVSKKNSKIKNKMKVVEIDSDNNIFSYYLFDEDKQTFSNNLGSITLNQVFDRFDTTIIQPFNLTELFDETVLVPKEEVVEVKEESTLTELDQVKKDLGQLLFMRSLISPIDFEEKITIGQLISAKQKQINDLNFKEVEQKMSEDKFFDDLFEQSFTPIKHEYENVYAGTSEEADFFTPDGERSKLSDDINQIIRTPQFKNWFGDWELSYIYKDTDALEIECSKVLTDNFEPKLVWHGTGQQFSYFIFDKFPAAYFAVNREYSQFFADLQGGGDGYVIPFFLNVRNPLDLTHFKTNKVKTKEFFDYLYLMTGLTMEELEVNPIFLSKDLPELETWMFIRNNPKMLKKISDTKLYDGIHFYETNPNMKDAMSPAHSTEAYITFSADQCKIADPDRGTLLLASLKSFLLEKGGKI